MRERERDSERDTGQRERERNKSLNFMAGASSSNSLTACCLSPETIINGDYQENGSILQEDQKPDEIVQNADSCDHCHTSNDDSSLLPSLPDDVVWNIITRIPRCKIQVLRSVCRKWREVIGSDHYFEARERIGVEEAWLYASISDCQGVNSWFAFDSHCGRWHRLPPIPGSQQRNVLTLQFAVLGGKLLVSGMVERENIVAGATGVFLYDPRSNTWKRAAPLNTGRWFCMSGVVDGKLYVAGGIGTCNNLALVQTVEIYSIEEDRWDQVEAGKPVELMTLPGYQAVLDGKLFAKNIGWGPRLGVSYDPIEGCLQELSAQMVKGWTGPTAALDGEIYIVDFNCNHQLKVWDRKNDTWQAVGDVQMPGSFHKPWAVQLVAFKGKLCLLLPDLTLLFVDIRKALKNVTELSHVRAEVHIVDGLEAWRREGELSVNIAAVLGCQVLAA